MILVIDMCVKMWDFTCESVNAFWTIDVLLTEIATHCLFFDYIKLRFFSSFLWFENVYGKVYELMVQQQLKLY